MHAYLRSTILNYLCMYTYNIKLATVDNFVVEFSAEEEEYIPPKLDVTEVKEDDAFYSKRCGSLIVVMVLLLVVVYSVVNYL